MRKQHAPPLHGVPTETSRAPGRRSRPHRPPPPPPLPPPPPRPALPPGRRGPRGGVAPPPPPPPPSLFPLAAAGSSRVGSGANPCALVPQHYFAATDSTKEDFEAMQIDWRDVCVQYFGSIGANGLLRPGAFTNLYTTNY